MYLWWKLCTLYLHMPGESYGRQLRSLLLCLCDIFQVLTNYCPCVLISSLIRFCFCFCFSQLQLTQCMDAALVFANSHLMLSHANKLAVIAAHTDRRYLLDLPVKFMTMQCSFKYLYKTKQQQQQEEEIY